MQVSRHRTKTAGPKDYSKTLRRRKDSELKGHWFRSSPGAGMGTGRSRMTLSMNHCSQSCSINSQLRLKACSFHTFLCPISFVRLFLQDGLQRSLLYCFTCSLVFSSGRDGLFAVDEQAIGIEASLSLSHFSQSPHPVKMIKDKEASRLKRFLDAILSASQASH